MSDYFEEPGIEPEDEPTEEDEVEIDEEQLLADEAEFKERYGFEHQCKCADDWATGNLGVVAVCFLNMCRDALEHLANARTEIADKDAEIAALRIELADR